MKLKNSAATRNVGASRITWPMKSSQDNTSSQYKWNILQIFWERINKFVLIEISVVESLLNSWCAVVLIDVWQSKEWRGMCCSTLTGPCISFTTNKIRYHFWLLVQQLPVLEYGFGLDREREGSHVMMGRPTSHGESQLPIILIILLFPWFYIQELLIFSLAECGRCVTIFHSQLPIYMFISSSSLR